MKKLFSEIPYIKGDGVVLRQLTRDDAEGLGRLVSSEKVYRYEPTFLLKGNIRM